MDKNKTAADRRHVSTSAMLLSVAAILAVLIVALAITPAVEARGENQTTFVEVNTIDELESALENNENPKLTADITVKGGLNINKAIIDLNDKTIHGGCTIFNVGESLELRNTGSYNGAVKANDGQVIQMGSNALVYIGHNVLLYGDVPFSAVGQSLRIESGGKIYGNVHYGKDSIIKFGNNNGIYIAAVTDTSIIAGENQRIEVNGVFGPENNNKEGIIVICGSVKAVGGISLNITAKLIISTGAQLEVVPSTVQMGIGTLSTLEIHGSVFVNRGVISNYGSIIFNNGTLKMKDGTINGTGRIAGDGVIENHGAFTIGGNANVLVNNVAQGSSVFVDSLLCDTLTIVNLIGTGHGSATTVVHAEHFPLKGLTVTSEVDSSGSKYNDHHGTVGINSDTSQLNGTNCPKIVFLGNGSVSEGQNLTVNDGIELHVGNGSVKSFFAINGNAVTHVNGAIGVGGLILEKNVEFTVLGRYEAHTLAIKNNDPGNFLHYSNYNTDGLSIYTTLLKAINDCSGNENEEYTIWSNGNTFIDSDLVITKNITLNVMDKLTVDAGTELTVDGILNLYVKGSKLVLKESSGSSGAVMINGCLSSAVKLDSHTPEIMLEEQYFTPVGAYYSIVVNEDEDGNEMNTKFIYISPFLKAIENIKDAEENKIELKGGDMVFGDISVGGEGDGYRVIVSVGFTAKSVTISQISLIFEEGCRVSAIVRNGSATAEIDGMVGTEISFTSCTDSSMSVSGELSGGGMKVRGAMSLNNASVVEATISGNVTISGTSTVDNLIINEDGLVNVPAGTELDTDTLKILGSVVLNGNIEAKKIFVGIGEDKIRPYGRTLGAETSVSGSGSISVSEYWVIAEGSDVDGAFLQEYKSTFYDRSSSPNVTAYVPSASDTPIGIITDTAPGNAEWKGWYAGNRTTADVSSEPIGTYNTVRSLIDYDIYSVTIAADKAVSKVFIDNELMTRNADGTWSASIAAGMHEISYKLKAGYMGTGVLTQESGGPGISIDGMSITVEGDKADFVLDLSGFTWVGWVDPDSEPPIPFPQPVPTPSSASDEGVTVTDCLLVVLIGIVVITSMVLAGRMLKR